jgi:hypothetical protein
VTTDILALGVAWFAVEVALHRVSRWRLPADVRNHCLTGRSLGQGSFLRPSAVMPALPARLALDQVAIWEMPLAILILLASINGMARRAGGIYTTSLVGL